MEKTLSDIEKGKFKKDDFLTMIKNFTVEAVDDIKKDTAMLKNFKVALPEGEESIGNALYVVMILLKVKKALDVLTGKMDVSIPFGKTISL